MKITGARRVSQIFFFALFLWLGFVNTIGAEMWQLRGWPVNLFIQLDPLSAAGTILSSRTLHRGLALSLIIIIPSFFLGRFFCGWICPTGTLNHFFSFLAHSRKKTPDMIKLNASGKGMKIKYYVLTALLAAAFLPPDSRTLLIGLLDPVTLLSRTLNIFFLPLAGSFGIAGALPEKIFGGAFAVFFFFALIAGLNAVRPRFFCRYICPLGALLGVFSRLPLFGPVRDRNSCVSCGLCEKNCEGACSPSENLNTAECLLCLNCLKSCPEGAMSWGDTVGSPQFSEGPELSRRGFAAALTAGALTAPALELTRLSPGNHDASLIRPPGSLAEKDFLRLCVRCGQCMRICPSGIIQPLGLMNGPGNLWTPTLNFRAGTSGCLYDCLACGPACPTGAIRSLSAQEKHGEGTFRIQGPVKTGTAFIDRGRCLPWAMGQPCIVCQENCPLSPKAIYTDEYFEPARGAVYKIWGIKGRQIELSEPEKMEISISSGDFFVRDGHSYNRLTSLKNGILYTHKKTGSASAGIKEIKVYIRLQRPWIDISKCTGCGICEHVCPVKSLPAVRVSSEGESRNPDKKIFLRTGRVT